MTPDHKTIVLEGLPILTSIYDAGEKGNLSDVFRYLSALERLASYYKSKMTQKTILDPNPVDDEEL